MKDSTAKPAENEPNKNNATFDKADDLEQLRQDFETIGICKLPFVEDGYVMDEDDAEMIMRSIRAVQAEKKTIKEFYEKKLAQLVSAEKGIFRVFGSYLEELAVRLIKDQGGKKKSITMPWGVLGFRMGPDKMEILDEDKLIAFITSDDALALTDLVKSKLHISKTE